MVNDGEIDQALRHQETHGEIIRLLHGEVVAASDGPLEEIGLLFVLGIVHLLLLVAQAKEERYLVVDLLDIYSHPIMAKR